MGTYHLNDVSKVRVFYRGNRKTWGRCHKLDNDCPGEAIAKNCAAGGGDRVFLSDHMKKLWAEVGFVPTLFALDESDKSEDDIQQANKDTTTLSKDRFPSLRQIQEPSKRDIELFDGICVKNFPKTLDEKEILTFLTDHGIPLEHGAEKIRIKRGERNSSVIVNDLSPTEVQTIFDSIHFHKSKIMFFEVPLFCKPLRNMTPIKNSESSSLENNKAGQEPKKDGTPKKAESTSKGKENGNKSTIPGLPEEDRLKNKKKKKAKQAGLSRATLKISSEYSSYFPLRTL
jgi:hypothetical protein